MLGVSKDYTLKADSKQYDVTKVVILAFKSDGDCTNKVAKKETETELEFTLIGGRGVSEAWSGHNCYTPSASKYWGIIKKDFFDS